MSSRTRVDDSLLTVEEVAELTGFAPRSLYNQRLRGEGIGALGFNIGRAVRWRYSTLLNYLAELEANAGSGA